MTARHASTVHDLVDAHPDTALGVSLDVTDQTQVTAAVQRAVDQFGLVDVLVNNAGYGYRAAVEEGEDDAVAQLARPVEEIKLSRNSAHTSKASVLPGRNTTLSDSIKLSSVAVDCPNAIELADFYAEITGSRVTFAHEAWATVQGPGGRIDFQTAPPSRCTSTSTSTTL